MRLFTFIVLTLSVFLISCETEDDNGSNTNNNNTSNSGNNSSIGITYSVDGVQQPASDYTFTMLSIGGMGILSIHNSAISQDSLIITSITVTQIDSLPNSYVIPNTADVVSNNNQMSFSRGSAFNNSGIWNNVFCDPIYSPDVNLNEGAFTVTDIDVNSKTISGTFSQELCKGNNETILVEGEFNDLTYTLLY